MTDDDSPLVVSGRAWPSFVAQTVVIAPGCEVTQWRDALVVVESGEVELETTTAIRRRFRSGDMLWLTGLSLRCLCNSGDEPAVLKAVSRRGPPLAQR